MTFVQLLATEKSAYMACDLRLTNPATGKREPDFAYKLIRVQRPRFSALIGFTGIAFLRGKAVGVWIAEEIEKLDANARVESLLDALAQAESILPRPGSVIDRRLTFAVAAMVGTQSLVSLVSNFEELIDGHISRVPVARDAMTTSGFKPKSELYLATGSGATVKVSGHKQLLLSLRSGVEDLRIFELLRDLNIEVSAKASKAGDDSVSPGCYVGSVHATGQGTRRPFLTDEQEGDFIPPEAEQTFKLLESRLGRKIDAFGRPMPIRMVQEAVAISPGTDKGRREQLKLRPDSAEVWNNFGSSLANRRRWDEAIDAYEKALSLDPAYVHALANLAKAFWLYRKDFSEADRLYAEAITVAGASVPSFILSDFAIFCHEALGDLQRAAVRDISNTAFRFIYQGMKNGWGVFGAPRNTDLPPGWVFDQVQFPVPPTSQTDYFLGVGNPEAHQAFTDCVSNNGVTVSSISTSTYNYGCDEISRHVWYKANPLNGAGLDIADGGNFLRP